MVYKETIKKLDMEGLYVIVTKVGNLTYIKLMSEQHDIPVYSIVNKPIHRITDFIKLFNETLHYLDWTVKDFINIECYAEAVMKMKSKICYDERLVTVIKN